MSILVILFDLTNFNNYQEFPLVYTIEFLSTMVNKFM
jgi:hypothetical protein